MKVGVPRAMLFHHYGECWLDFIAAAGAEPVPSEPTTNDIITTGALRADNETCLPVKVFRTRHVAWKEVRRDPPYHAS